MRQTVVRYENVYTHGHAFCMQHLNSLYFFLSFLYTTELKQNRNENIYDFYRFVENVYLITKLNYLLV